MLTEVDSFTKLDILTIVDSFAMLDMLAIVDSFTIIDSFAIMDSFAIIDMLTIIDSLAAVLDSLTRLIVLTLYSNESSRYRRDRGAKIIRRWERDTAVRVIVRPIAYILYVREGSH